MNFQELSLDVGDGVQVSGLLQASPGADWLYVFGHGAGAGMLHRSMQAIADSLADVGIASLRYNFPYMEHGGAISPKPMLYATVRAAIRYAERIGFPLIAGGRSMGGRMTSNALALEPLPSVRGLVFYGFPLHPTGKPGVERAEHLAKVQIPMLFLQGTRDSLADLGLLRPIVADIGARMHVVEDADHSFHVRKSSGSTDALALTEMAAAVREWVDRM